MATGRGGAGISIPVPVPVGDINPRPRPVPVTGITNNPRPLPAKENLFPIPSPSPRGKIPSQSPPISSLSPRGKIPFSYPSLIFQYFVNIILVIFGGRRIIRRRRRRIPVHRKIFVHGLGWAATNETLITALKPFGAIEECNVVTDKTTGRSKGYGFVLFKTRAAVRKALKEPQKKIRNRIAACQLASTGPVQNQPGSEMSARKLYVANVGPQIGAEKLRAFFAKYGEIEDGPLGFDKIFDGFKLLCSIAVEGRSTKNNNNINASASPAPVMCRALILFKESRVVYCLLGEGICGCGEKNGGFGWKRECAAVE